jgi:hypothetical protein
MSSRHVHDMSKCSKPQAAIPHNSDMVTNALIWNLMVPCAFWLVIIGVVILVVEGLKAMIRRHSRNARPPKRRR